MSITNYFFLCNRFVPAILDFGPKSGCRCAGNSVETSAATILSGFTPKDVYSCRLPWPIPFKIGVFTQISCLTDDRKRLEKHGPTLRRTFVDAQPARRGTGKYQGNFASRDSIPV